MHNIPGLSPILFTEAHVFMMLMIIPFRNASARLDDFARHEGDTALLLPVYLRTHVVMYSLYAWLM